MEIKLSDIFFVAIIIFFGLVWRILDLPILGCFKVDFLLLGLFYVFINHNKIINIWFAWILGLLVDALNGFVLGNVAIQYAFVFLTVSLIQRHIVQYSAIQQSIVLVMINIVTTTIGVIIYQVIYGESNYCGFYTIIANAIIWPFYYLFLTYVNKSLFSTR